MRAEKALDLAASGRRVALVSSGDAGIYAMASLVFELVERSDRPAWQGVAIEVSPGVSALQAAAARAGAPLGHDFCAISLSDLLTPWPVIERRLEAAAAADFVTVLYNPASPRRREGLARAIAIFSAARPPHTPVIHAFNVGRADEAVDAFPPGELRPGDRRHDEPHHRRRPPDAAGRAPGPRGLRLHTARLSRRRAGMRVHFIGAGPGAPDLITVRGLRLIRRCPVVLYAGSLVPRAVIAEAGADAPVAARVDRHRAARPRCDHRRDRAARMARIATSRACIRATRRSTARSPSRSAACGRSASPTTSRPACRRSPPRRRRSARS